GHHVAVAGHTLAVERGLDQPALAQPRIALGEQQAIAKQGTEQLYAGALDEVPASSHEQFLDGVRVVDQQDAVWTHPRLDDVAVLSRTRRVEGELIASERGYAGEEVAALRPREGRFHGRRHGRLPHLDELLQAASAGRIRPPLVAVAPVGP